MPSLILRGMKTVWVTDKPWSSPDGKVTIWLIKLEDGQGERADYNTMSKAIATLDWSGDIELYTNDKGKEYVRQAPKEEAQQDSFGEGQAWGNAKTNATQLVINTMPSGTTLAQAVEATISAARVLYAAQPGEPPKSLETPESDIKVEDLPL